jgi:hypothetical protein
MLAREWAARDGHFIAAYAVACWYQVTVAGSGRFHVVPVSGSNCRPIRAARTSSARRLPASFLVMNYFDLLRPAARQRTTNRRRRPARRRITYALTSNLFTLALSRAEAMGDVQSP